MANLPFKCARCGYEGASQSEQYWSPLNAPIDPGAADETRKAHFKALDEMTLEQRTRKIEEWIFDRPPAMHPGHI